MLPETTEAVTRALQAAAGWAVRASAAEVRPLDLLGGLLEEEEGRPAGLLASAGLEATALRAVLSAGLSPAVPPANASVPLSAVVRRAFDEAASLARSLSTDRLVSTDTLLLALLRVDPSLRGRLESLGLRFAEIEKEVLADTTTPLHLEQPLALAELTERVDAARALDTAANRAREALRVPEDYCRFCPADAVLAG